MERSPLSSVNDEGSDVEDETKEELYSELRQLYAKKYLVAQSLESLEQRIYTEEENYLLKHQQFGNIVQGINMKAMLNFNPYRSPIRLGRQRTTTSNSNCGTGNSRYYDKGQFANSSTSACSFSGITKFVTPESDMENGNSCLSIAESCSSASAMMSMNMSARGNIGDNVDTETDRQFTLETNRSRLTNTVPTQSHSSNGRLTQRELDTDNVEESREIIVEERRIPQSVRIFSNSSATSNAAVFGHSSYNDDNPSTDDEQVSPLSNTAQMKTKKQYCRKSCKRRKIRCKDKTESNSSLSKSDDNTSSLWHSSPPPSTSTSNVKNKKTTKRKHKNKRKHKTVEVPISRSPTPDIGLFFKKEELDISDFESVDNFTLDSFLENYQEDDKAGTSLLDYSSYFDF